MIDARRLRRLMTSMKSGLRGVRDAPLGFALSVGTTAAGLLMLSVHLLVMQNVRGVLDRHGAELSLVAFLDAELSADPARRAALDREVREIEGVAGADFVGPERALERLRADLGDEAAILDDLSANPLPASFEIALEPAARSPGATRRLARRVGALAGVEEVRYGEAWVESYARVLRALEWIGAAMAACLVGVLGVIVAGTVRLAVHARADEIQIQRLVGASRLFVRLPFCIEGALQGALGAILALGALYGLFDLGLPLLGETLELALGLSGPSFLSSAEVAAVLVFGTAVGTGAAVLSVTRVSEAR